MKSGETYPLPLTGILHKQRRRRGKFWTHRGDQLAKWSVHHRKGSRGGHGGEHQTKRRKGLSCRNRRYSLSLTQRPNTRDSLFSLLNFFQYLPESTAEESSSRNLGFLFSVNVGVSACVRVYVSFFRPSLIFTVGLKRILRLFATLAYLPSSHHSPTRGSHLAVLSSPKVRYHLSTRYFLSKRFPPFYYIFLYRKEAR